MTASFRLVLVLFFHNFYNLHAISVWKVENGAWFRKQQKIAGSADDVLANSSVAPPSGKIVARQDTTQKKTFDKGGAQVKEKTTDKVTIRRRRTSGGKSKVVKEKVEKKTVEKIVEKTTFTTTCTPKEEIKIVGSSMSGGQRKGKLAHGPVVHSSMGPSINKTKNRPIHSSMGAHSALDMQKKHKAEVEKKAKEKIAKARVEKNQKMIAANARVEEMAKKAAIKSGKLAEEKQKKANAAKAAAEKEHKFSAKKAEISAKAHAKAEKAAKFAAKQKKIWRQAVATVKAEQDKEFESLMRVCRKRQSDISLIIESGGNAVAHAWDKYLANSLFGLVDKVTAMGLLTFGKHGQRMVSLTHNTTKLKGLLKSLQGTSKGSAKETAVALGSARMDLHSNGRPATANVIVVISHGVPNTPVGKDRTTRAAEKVKKLGYRLIFVEVGFKGGEKFFQQLATKKTDVITVSHSCHLKIAAKKKLMAMKIKHAICSLDAKKK